MARTKTVVDIAELTKQIAEVEKKGEFGGFAELFKALSETEWATKNNLSAAILRSRAQEAKLPMKTQKGKPGRRPATAA